MGVPRGAFREGGGGGPGVHSAGLGGGVPGVHSGEGRGVPEWGSPGCIRQSWSEGERRNDP